MHLPQSHRSAQKIVTAGLLAVTLLQILFPEIQEAHVLAALVINILWVWT